jgi:hypothetical protein
MEEGRGKQQHPIFTISVLRYSICDLRVFNLAPVARGQAPVARGQATATGTQMRRIRRPQKLLLLAGFIPIIEIVCNKYTRIKIEV